MICVEKLCEGANNISHMFMYIAIPTKKNEQKKTIQFGIVLLWFFFCINEYKLIALKILFHRAHQGLFHSCKSQSLVWCHVNSNANLIGALFNRWSVMLYIDLNSINSLNFHCTSDQISHIKTYKRFSVHASIRFDVIGTASNQRSDLKPIVLHDLVLVSPIALRISNAKVIPSRKLRGILVVDERLIDGQTDRQTIIAKH